MAFQPPPNRQKQNTWLSSHHPTETKHMAFQPPPNGQKQNTWLSSHRPTETKHMAFQPSLPETQVFLPKRYGRSLWKMPAWRPLAVQPVRNSKTGSSSAKTVSKLAPFWSMPISFLAAFSFFFTSLIVTTWNNQFLASVIQVSLAKAWLDKISLASWFLARLGSCWLLQTSDFAF